MGFLVGVFGGSVEDFWLGFLGVFVGDFCQPIRDFWWGFLGFLCIPIQ